MTKERSFSYKNLALNVIPGVFHPGLFYSSKFFADFLSQCTFNHAKLLDIGCGSGLLSLVAAKQGALVTAIDINDKAVENTINNANKNGLSINCLKSDLFEEIDEEFDFVVINPPYYPRNPKTKTDHAWYCGDSHEYFINLFEGLPNYTHRQTKVFMILSDECDIGAIKEIAANYGYKFELVKKISFLLEENYIFGLRLRMPV